MNKDRTLLRVHAHAWFVAGFSVLSLLVFLVLKLFQVYFELGVDKPGWSLEQCWDEARRTVLERRLDDPSLWALICVASSAWLLTRGAAYVAHGIGLPSFLWTRRLRYWVWYIAMVGLSGGAYLLVVWLKSETFWYLNDPEHAKYAQTPIPQIQTFEGTLNVIMIVLACSLVPAVRALVDLAVYARTIEGQSPARSSAVLLARARLATLGIGPFALLGTAFFIYKLVKVLAAVLGTPPWNVRDELLDLFTGIAGALFVCLPIILATWELLLRSKTLGIEVKAIPGLFVVVWILLFLIRRDVFGPPDALVDEKTCRVAVQTPVKVVKYLGCMSGALLWFVPSTPGIAESREVVQP